VKFLNARFATYSLLLKPGADPEGGIGTIAYPPETYERNFAHYDYEQFGKQHSRY